MTFTIELFQRVDGLSVMGMYVMALIGPLRGDASGLADLLLSTHCRSWMRNALAVRALMNPQAALDSPAASRDANATSRSKANTPREAGDSHHGACSSGQTRWMAMRARERRPDKGAHREVAPPCRAVWIRPHRSVPKKVR